MSSLIRPYHHQDKEQVLNLLQLNTPKYFSPEERDDLIYYLDHELEYYYVIELDNIVVGCAGINLADEGKTGKLSWDILHPDYQGRSLGSQLVQHRLAKLKTIDDIEQIIVRTSQLVYPFYEKQGFKLISVVDDYWAEGFHLYLMRYEDLFNG